MDEHIELKELEENDRRDLLAFMLSIFNAEKMSKAEYFDVNLWEWQYKENPCGDSVIVLAREKNEIIGQYCVVPLILKCNGQILKAGLTIDLMVKEEFRRKGWSTHFT